MNPKLPLDQQLQLDKLIVEGRIVTAIQLYREATGQGLKESKQFVDAHAAEMRRKNPHRFAAAASRSDRPLPIATLLLALAVGGGVYLWQLGWFDEQFQHVRGWFDSPPPPQPVPSTRPAVEPLAREAPTAPAPTIIPETRPPVGRILRQPQSISGVWLDADLHAQPEAAELERLYRAKLENPEYIAWKNRPGIPQATQRFPEEAAIKDARRRLAAKVTVPEGTDPYPVPTSPDLAPPTIDGFMSPGEWDFALEVPIGVAGADTRLLLRADRRHLYMAVDAPQEITDAGYDQFRFYVHVDTAPALSNERLHVSPGGPQRTRAIRATHVRWQGSPPDSDDQRWKKYPISDWNIYARAAGASRMTDHRQYEAMLDLEETGLHPGVAFPAFVEVETDPRKDANGKFRGRRHLGMLGSQKQPHWFVIEGGD